MNGRRISWPSVPVGTLGEFPVFWFTLEPRRGQYDWRPLDNYIQTARSHGAGKIYFNLHGTPRWASSRPDESCGGLAPPGCKAAPADLRDWRDYVTAVSTRYKGVISYYELWDEADGHQWSGSIADMLNLARTAYPIIKSIDPGAVVLTPSESIRAIEPEAPGCSFSCWLARYLKAGGSQYADGISWHAYLCQAGRFGCTPEIGCDPSAPIECAGQPILNQIGLVRKLADENGMPGKPIFDTSGGWGLDRNITDAEQRAAYVSRWYIIQAGAGVQLADWWGWQVGNWGTLYDPGSNTGMSARAYLETYRWIVGATVGPCSADGRGIWSCAVTRPGGYQGLAVWSNSASAPYRPPPGLNHYRDLAGNQGSLRSGQPITAGIQPILLENQARP
jgi:hypothetical protein